jgi:hypothetical protein
VNWVRDRRDADVHVLVTAQQTGGGGWDFQLEYIGLRRFSGRTDTLGYVSDPNDVDIEVRDGLARTTALGLVAYAARSAVAPQLAVAFDPAGGEDAAGTGQPESDPWNLWVFRLGFNGSLEGEADQRGYSLRGNVSANRTSEAFKLDLNVSGRRSVDEFDLDDSTTVESISENYNARVLGVWTLGPRTSLGFTGRAERSTFSNVEYGASGGPAFEFNIYPYTESTRRSVTLRYSVQAAFFDYELTTVTGQTRETRFWPQGCWMFGSIEGTQYFHDLGVHRIDTFGVLEFRLLRGLSFNLFGSVSRIKDQFFLAAEGLTQDEILLQRRARETGFRYDLSAGFSYRFGSKFANVVNPRLGGGGGRFFFF